MTDLPAPVVGSSLVSSVSYSATGLELPAGMSYEQWSEVGGAIQRIARSWQWWFGDWLNYGEARYGEKYAQAIEQTGLDPGTLMNISWVCREVEISRRREVLSFAHHQEVAPVDPDGQDEWLDKAEREGWTRQELRQALKAPRELPNPEPPEGKYAAIVIDPPWPIEKIARDVRPNQKAIDYPTMSLDEISALPVTDLAADDGCHLYLWTTHKFLPDALGLVEQWGFRYQCLMTWRKNVGITPFSWMYDTEHVVFARRGSLDLLRNGLRLSFDAAVTRHSAKPDTFYERAIQASPGPRLEMFARQERDGFTVWGNEVQADAS